MIAPTATVIAGTAAKKSYIQRFFPQDISIGGGEWHINLAFRLPQQQDFGFQAASFSGVLQGGHFLLIGLSRGIPRPLNHPELFGHRPSLAQVSLAIQPHISKRRVLLSAEEAVPLRRP